MTASICDFHHTAFLTCWWEGGDVNQGEGACAYSKVHQLQEHLFDRIPSAALSNEV
jgi:hypothetical protein